MDLLGNNLRINVLNMLKELKEVMDKALKIRKIIYEQNENINKEIEII